MSIVLKDFVEFASRNDESPNNVNECLLRQVLTEVLPWSMDQAACDQCHFFFDQGELFMDIWYTFWKTKKPTMPQH